MWNRNRRGTLEARRFSLSEWDDAPNEDITTYDASNTTPNTSIGTNEGQLNINSIYDAIKNDAMKEEDLRSKGHLFDSTKVNPDINYTHHRKTSIVGAHPGNALKKLTRRTTEVTFTDPSTNSDSLNAPTSTNIWTRLLGGNDELWDKGDVYKEDDDDSEVSEVHDNCAPLKACSRSSYLETRHFFTTMGRYPYIIAASFFVLVLVLVVGMAAIQSEKQRHIQQMKNTAEFVVSLHVPYVDWQKIDTAVNEH
jgi:hypothetical protein